MFGDLTGAYIVVRFVVTGFIVSHECLRFDRGIVRIVVTAWFYCQPWLFEVCQGYSVLRALETAKKVSL